MEIFVNFPILINLGIDSAVEEPCDLNSFNYLDLFFIIFLLFITLYFSFLLLNLMMKWITAIFSGSLNQLNYQ